MGKEGLLYLTSVPRILNEEKIVSLAHSTGETDFHIQYHKTRSLSCIIKNVNSKWTEENELKAKNTLKIKSINKLKYVGLKLMD